MGKELSPIAQAMAGMIMSHADGVSAGLNAGYKQTIEALRPVLSAYDRALQDVTTKIPTYMHAAMELARTTLTTLEWNAACDQRRATEAQELDVAGRALKAGS